MDDMDDIVDGNTPHTEGCGDGPLGNTSFQELDFYKSCFSHVNLFTILLT